MYLANQVYTEDSVGLYNAYLDATHRHNLRSDTRHG